ncbi:DUF1990 family protein [Mycolicibacterium aubagnense]|uniref:DUF1990 domain-containing protein n=1 Tax=Mycolicibacterium aubagnense TaxID=319707 RepID=A0ABN5YKR5_9MYCO|nr:DUF1990 domain-containing protein [Mycolicibacterium aubagnense]TLH64055.1 DUF1990 domain-containing protein [Mycolicibacterium aubagnense]WGI30785.1 DUF1990 domain-containing protein [Mycolicibacterium aubagnense]BBX82277.1 hypothetical protein MAUB_01500 [Mycolicibacterium aubagnense]
MRLSDLAGLAFTYPDVGATAGELPSGYHHVHTSAQIGSGRARFDEAADAVLRWGMQRGVGMKVEATTVSATAGTDMLGHLGLVSVPCRVVYVVDEPDRRGFAYGTLPGHPESGEELFSVRYDPATDAVHAEISAFSRPALWWSRLGAPVARVAQRVIGRRYLRAV